MCLLENSNFPCCCGLRLLLNFGLSLSFLQTFFQKTLLHCLQLPSWKIFWSLLLVLVPSVHVLSLVWMSWVMLFFMLSLYCSAFFLLLLYTGYCMVCLVSLWSVECFELPVWLDVQLVPLCLGTWVEVELLDCSATIPAAIGGISICTGASSNITSLPMDVDITPKNFVSRNSYQLACIFVVLLPFGTNQGLLVVLNMELQAATSPLPPSKWDQ